MTTSTAKYVWFLAKYLILHSALISQGGVIRPISGLYAKECLHTAACWMAHGDLRRALNMTYQEFYDQSKPFIQKHKEFVQSGQAEINEKCAVETKNCQDKLMSDAESLGPTKPPGLISECPADTLNYMLLLCASSAKGYWPPDIYAEIVPNHPTCGLACDYKMAAYHAYHLANNKTFPQDFPKSWGRRLEEEKEALKSAKTSKGRARQRTGVAEAEVAETKSTSAGTTIIGRTPNFYLEAGDKFTADEAANDARDPKLTNMACAPGTWITKMKDALPYLIFGYCNGPEKTDQLANFIHPSTSSTLEAGAVSFKFRSIWWDCRDSKKIVPKVTGDFSFMTGVKFRTHVEEHTGQVFDLGNWRCGGWSEWTGYYKEIEEEETHVLECPPLTAMCSLEYATVKDAAEGHARGCKKYHDITCLEHLGTFPYNTRSVTYIKIGCCEVPTTIYYSAAIFITSDYTNGEKLTAFVSTRKFIDGGTHSEDSSYSEVPYPSEGTRTYFCPQGEFIYGLSLKAIPAAFAVLLWVRPTPPSLNDTSGSYFNYPKIADTFAYFDYPVIAVDFYCKPAMGPNNTASAAVSVIDSDVYSPLNLAGNSNLGGQTSPPAAQYACSSHAVGLSSRHNFYQEKPTNGSGSGENLLVAEYAMHCSHGNKSEPVQKSTKVHEIVLGNADRNEHKMNFDCPKNYALCGIQTLILPKVPAKEDVGRRNIFLVEGFSDKATPWNAPPSKVWGAPIQGLYLAYICCPIPIPPGGVAA